MEDCKMKDINICLDEFKNTRGAVLLDVRTKGEYAEGHVPGSVNVCVTELKTLTSGNVLKKDTPIYVYCRRGARGKQATSVLIREGYTNVKNIGGIVNYKGKLEA